MAVRLFPAHLTSLRGEVGWPARSPNVAPCDYFLWDYVKAEVYKHQPTTIDGVKAAFRQTVNEIPQKMTLKVMETLGIA